MRLVRRALLVVGVVLAAVVAWVTWSTFGSWPVPDGYSFPRHSMWGGPQALFEGLLQDDDGCIRASSVGESFAVVWPPGYRLSVTDGVPAVHGGGREVGMGEPVRMGGGYYEDGAPPPQTRDLGSCQAPFFLSTGFSDPAR